jgi:CBS domain-containing protein
MKVDQLMSRNVVTAPPDAPFRKIWELIFEKRVSGVPIIDEKKVLVGIISEEDLIEKLYPSHEEYFFDPSSHDFEQMEENVAKVSKLKAKDFMSKNVHTTTEDTPIMRAASSMLIYKVSCLPVIRKHRRKKTLAGIICKGDIFGHIFRANVLKKGKKSQPRARKS